MGYTARAALAGLVAVALLSGCGSSKKAASTTTTTAGAASSSSGRIDAAFLTRVDAVCARAAAGAPQFPYTNFDPVHPDVKLLPKVGAFFAKRQAIADAVPRQARALGQPATGRTTWDQMLTLVTQDRAIADRQIRAAEASDVRGFVATVNQITQVSSQLHKLADQAGVASSSPCRMIF